MRAASLKLVDALLQAKLGTPSYQRSMGQVFLTCAKEASPASPDVRQRAWGEQIGQQECADLVLETQEKGLFGIDDVLIAAAVALLLL